MAAPKGNEFWKQRSSFGRKPQFETADALWDACQQYFLWVEEHPLYESKPFSYEGKITMATIPKARAMTIQGMCIYLDIAFQTWKNYLARDAYVEVCTRVEEIIRTQKFELASADLLNASIIARDLGLRDHVDQKIDQTNHVDKETRVALIKALLNKGKTGAEEKPDIDSGEIG